MLLYYISDRKQFPGTSSEQKHALIRRFRKAAAAGVDLIQLREKNLANGELERLARDALQAVRDYSSQTRLLINSRIDIALAVGADGVHLTSTDISASDARAVSAASLREKPSAFRELMAAVSCHSVEEVRSAESHGADFVVLAPIFEKAGTSITPVGLEMLRRAATRSAPDLRVEAGDNRLGVPVLALGGVSIENASACLRAGASGLAGIRLFQEGDVNKTVGTLREIEI